MKSVAYDKADFDYPTPELAKRIPADLGYAGFKLTFPFDGKNVQNQFLVFGGASYLRAIGKGQQFGLSGRGIAVDTGLPSGEEFPSLRSSGWSGPPQTVTPWWCTGFSTGPV